MFAAIKILVEFNVASCFSTADSTDQNVRYAFIFKVLYLLKTLTTTPFKCLFQTVLKEVFSLLLCCYNRTCELFLFCHIWSVFLLWRSWSALVFIVIKMPANADVQQTLGTYSRVSGLVFSLWLGPSKPIPFFNKYSCHVLKVMVLKNY